MAISPKDKKKIDGMSYYQLLKTWRFSERGHLFRGETGEYYAQRLAQLKANCHDPASISKAVGWSKR